MRFDTEGIVLKEVKLSDGRRIIHLFTRKEGKICAGTSISEKGKSKSALALKPFTVAEYSIYKNRESYNISSAEFKKSYYGLGEDIDRYIYGSYVLELTEKILAEGEPAPGVYSLLMDFLFEMELRTKKFDTLVIGYEVKLLKVLGIMPDLSACKGKTEKDGPFYLHVPDGRVICEKCKIKEGFEPKESLIYTLSFDILEVLKFLAVKPLSELRRLALNEQISDGTQELIKKYMAYHLEIGSLKSEELLKLKI